MSLTKSDVAINIALKAPTSAKSANQIINKFIDLIISESCKKDVKVSNFGTFKRKNTPSRVGRNPKTGEEYIISEKNKLFFIVSNTIKKRIN